MWERLVDIYCLTRIVHAALPPAIVDRGGAKDKAGRGGSRLVYREQGGQVVIYGHGSHKASKALKTNFAKN